MPLAVAMLRGSGWETLRETSRNLMDTRVICHSSFAYLHLVVLTSFLFSQREDDKDNKEEV